MDNENKNMKIGLVIMASGLGKRFGGNKLMAILNNKPLIKWVIDSTDGLFDKRVVVTRNEAVLNLCQNLNVDCIIHEFPGRNDTVRLGLNALKDDVDYCFFMQADQPLISTLSIRKLISFATENNENIVRASYGPIVGSPMGFPKSFFDLLLTLPQGKGGNYVALTNPSLVKIQEVSSEYELWDVDTISDLQKLNDIVNPNT